MKHIHTYKIFESFKKVPKNLYNVYGDVIVDMNDCFEFIEDKLSELDDIGYETITSFSPMTMAKARKTPELYININKTEDGDFHEKYLVDSNIEDITGYMNSRGFKVNNCVDNSNPDPIKFEFTYRKASYQISFIKGE